MAICSVAGCVGKARTRGWCQKHYHRWWRHGDPLAGRTPKGDLLKFLENHRNYASGECLIWPYGKNNGGYGHLKKGGRLRLAHSVMLELVAGQKPTPGHEVAHSCGNRACVAPRHLRWATPSENNMDKLLHGTHNRGERHPLAKLTEAQVLEIRELIADGVSQRKIGKLYDIDRSNVGFIKAGKVWAWLEGREERR